MEDMAVTENAAPSRAPGQEPVADRPRATRQDRARGRNRMFGVLLATISLGMFAIVVAFVIVFHALEAYRVIPGF